jgi:hypothetical protein
MNVWSVRILLQFILTIAAYAVAAYSAPVDVPRSQCGSDTQSQPGGGERRGLDRDATLVPHQVPGVAR